MYIFDNIRECISSLFLPYFEFLLLCCCFFRLLRKCRAYWRSSTATSRFLCSSFIFDNGSIVCFKIAVVLLKFAVVFIQISSSWACGSEAIANVGYVVVS